MLAVTFVGSVFVCVSKTGDRGSDMLDADAFSTGGGNVGGIAFAPWYLQKGETRA